MKMRPSFAMLSTSIHYVSLLFFKNIFIEPEKVQPYMQNIALTCIKVLIEDKCDEIPETFKKEVAKFIKNVIMSTHIHLLQGFEA
jgi:hypothetical protein